MAKKQLPSLSWVTDSQYEYIIVLEPLLGPSLKQSRLKYQDTHTHTCIFPFKKK